MGKHVGFIMIEAISKYCKEQNLSYEVYLSMINILMEDYEYFSKKSLTEIYNLTLPKVESRQETRVIRC